MNHQEIKLNLLAAIIAKRMVENKDNLKSDIIQALEILKEENNEETIPVHLPNQN